MSRPDPSLGRQAYYAQASSWAEDIHGGLRRSRTLAWAVAASACVVAVLEALALVLLMPLKSVVPYTLSVDRQTGYVETAQPLKPGPLTQDAAVTQAFLAQYVIARETFDATDLRDAYRKVSLWSVGAARESYVRDMLVANPRSPVKLYGRSTIVHTTVKSISLISAGTALVRFDTQRHEAGVATGQPEPWAAVIAFRYTGEPLRMGDRLLNPLGFQVTSYRRDAEAVPRPAPPATTAAETPEAGP